MGLFKSDFQTYRVAASTSEDEAVPGKMIPHRQRCAIIVPSRSVAEQLPVYDMTTSHGIKREGQRPLNDHHFTEFGRYNVERPRNGGKTFPVKARFRWRPASSSADLRPSTQDDAFRRDEGHRLVECVGHCRTALSRMKVASRSPALAASATMAAVILDKSP